MQGDIRDARGCKRMCEDAHPLACKRICEDIRPLARGCIKGCKGVYLRSVVLACAHAGAPCAQLAQPVLEDLVRVRAGVRG